MRSLFPLITLSLPLVFSACVHKPTVRQVAQAAPETSMELPDHARWLEVKNFADTLNLDEEGTSISMSSGGTSVYAVVTRGDRPIGAVIPENSASSLSGEVLSFNLARAFGVGRTYQEGVYFFVTGANLKAFRAMVPTTPYREAKFKNKEENRVAIVNRMAKNPGGIDAIYKAWGSKPEDYDALVRVSSNTINSAHILDGSTKPVAHFLKCQGPQPDAGVTVSLGEGSTTELEAARELSSILLIDALTQQWDRFSGGNLQYVSKKGVSKFVAYDNGGTWGGTKHTQRALGLVSRFDRTVATEILEMNKFLNQGVGQYKGFRTEKELIAGLGIEHMPSNFSKFKESLALVAQHIQKNANCFFP